MSRWVGAALILIALIFVLRVLAPQTIGETARRKLVVLLQTHYPGYQISVRRGHFDPQSGLVFEGLKISESLRSGSWSTREMLSVDRITIEGSFDSRRLMDQENPFRTKRVVVQGVNANAWMDSEGQVSLASLLPLPKFGPPAPRTDISDVTLRVFGNQDATRPVEGHLHNAVITCLHQGESQKLVLKGSTDFIDQFSGIVEIKDGNVDVRMAVHGIRPDQALVDRLPPQWSKPMREFRDLSCVMDATVAVYLPKDGAPNYRLESSFYEGRFTHARLPRPVTNLRGKISCDPSGIFVYSGQANFGDALIRLRESRTYGYSLSCDVDVKASVQGLLLNNRFAAALPAKAQQDWGRIQPEGHIDVNNVELTCRNGQWKSSADIVCQGIDFRFDKFPYPVEQLVGSIKLRDGLATAQSLSGRVGNSRLHCKLHLPSSSYPDQTKWVELETEDAVPIDSTLLSSLSPIGGATKSSLETFVRSLEPSGSVRLARAFFGEDPQRQKVRELDIRVVDGGLRYEKFAYRLYNVAGTVTVKGNTVGITGFRATNANAGVVQCDGVYQMPVKEEVPSTRSGAGRISRIVQPSNLMLNFRASNVLMDESLRRSLPEPTQHVWDAISPSGILDHLGVNLRKRGQFAPLRLDITANQTEQQAVTNRTLSLRPPALPYRLDVTGGTVRFDGSRVLIDSIRGSHDASKLSANGTCVPGSDGRWILALDLHGGSRLLPDAELIASLPTTMRNAMRSLQLRGPVGIRGKTQIAIPCSSNAETSIDWNLDLQLEGNRIGDVGPVEAIRGGLNVRGHRDDSVLLAEGAVNIDSMHVYDQQLSGIRGPFSVFNDRLTLGSPASGKAITGKLFDGSVGLDGVVVLSTGNFDTTLKIDEAQVPTLLAEYGYADQELTGLFSGNAQLQGNLGTTDLLKGTGSARLKGANLYQLPPLVQVLNLLSINPSEDHAFTDGEIQFSLFADTARFSEIQLWGDIVSLYGDGTLDHRRDLDLTFNTSVSKNNILSRVVRPLSSPRLTFFTIDVTGPVGDPQIQRRALNGFGESLGRLFPNLNPDPEEALLEDPDNTPESATNPATKIGPKNFRR